MYYCGICHKIAVGYLLHFTQIWVISTLYTRKKPLVSLNRNKNAMLISLWQSTDVKHSAENLMIDYGILRMFVLSWHHSSLTRWLWLTGTDTSARWTSVQSSVVWSEPCLHGDEIHRNNMCNYFPPSLSECFWYNCHSAESWEWVSQLLSVSLSLCFVLAFILYIWNVSLECSFVSLRCSIWLMMVKTCEVVGWRQFNQSVGCSLLEAQLLEAPRMMMAQN